MNYNSFENVMLNSKNPNYNPDFRFPEQTPIGMAYIPFQPWEEHMMPNKVWKGYHVSKS